MKKKIIAITQRLAIQESYQERREILACEWGEFCKNHHILPIPLSYAIPIQEYSLALDGVILSGGNDLSFFKSESNSLIRDCYEREVIEFCIKRHIPLLGVCRGAQLIAHYFNATLCEVDGHIGEHLITWNSGRKEYVNSYHHYQVTRISDEMCVEAVSGDGGVEAFSHSSFPVFGMMWHPEREQLSTYSTQKMLKKFLENRK